MAESVTYAQLARGHSRCASVVFHKPGELLIVRYDDGPDIRKMTRQWYRVQEGPIVERILEEMDLTLRPRPAGVGLQAKLL